MEPPQWTDSDGLGPIIGGILCSVSKFPNENIPQKGQQTTTKTVLTYKNLFFNLTVPYVTTVYLSFSPPSLFLRLHVS